MRVLKFTNQSYGEDTDHVLWSFGDGSSQASTALTVDHTYASSGDYTVTLEAWSVSSQYGYSTKVVQIPSSEFDVAFYFGVLPGPPSDFTATTYSSTRIDTEWSAIGIVDASGFKLERSLDGTSFNPLVTLPMATTSYDDTGLSELTTYWYRVKAYNGPIDSSYSNVDSAITSATPVLGYYAVGNDNGSGDIGFALEGASDFLSWSQSWADFTGLIQSVAKNNNVYAFATSIGLYSSTDFNNLTFRFQSTDDASANDVSWNDIIYSSRLGMFIAVGSGSGLATSPDGINWTRRDADLPYNGGSGYTIYGLVDATGKVVLGAGSGYNSFSTDGTTWQSGAQSNYNTFMSICYFDEADRFVGIGTDGETVYMPTSIDGSSWSMNYPSAYFGYYSVASFGDKLFLAGNSSYTIGYTQNFSSVTVIDLSALVGSTVAFDKVDVVVDNSDNTTLVAFGQDFVNQNTVIVFSTDGVNFSQATTDSTYLVSKITALL